MGLPTKPTLDYSYVAFQQSQGDNAFPGTEIDNDHANLKLSIDETIDFLTGSFRSDGVLKPTSYPGSEDLTEYVNTATTAATEASASAVSAAASAVSAAASLDQFTDLYLGAKSADPTLDNDGNALQDGATYWNTSAKVLRIYDLGTTTWANGVQTSGITTDTFVGDGVTVGFTLSVAPTTIGNTQVYVGGVYQTKAEYSLDGATLTFNTAPPNGVGVEVMTFEQILINVPSDGSVTAAKLAPGAAVSNIGYAPANIVGTCRNVATRTALKAVDTTLTTIAYLSEGLRKGLFVWTPGDYSAEITADTAEGMYLKADAIAASAGAWIRVTDRITPQMCGAVVDGVTNCYAESKLAFDLAVREGLIFYMPEAALEYLWDLTAVGTANWDPTRIVLGARRAIPILGAGVNLTNIKIINATSIGWHIKSTTDWFDPVWDGFSCRGAFDFPLAALGDNDLVTDPVNMWTPTNVSFENSFDGANNVALRLNYIVGGTVNNLRCNSYALAVADVLVAVNGTALECRQVKFVTFNGGGFGNANISVDFKDGFNDGCAFHSPTLENANYCVAHRSSNSGGNSFYNAQMTNVLTYEVFSSGAISGKDVAIVNPNCDGPCRVDPANYVQVRIHDDAPVATPASPATGVAIVNNTGRDVWHNWWGLTTLTSINIDGAGDGITATSGGFLWRAGKSVAHNYTGTLTMRWRNAG